MVPGNKPYFLLGEPAQNECNRQREQSTSMDELKDAIADALLSDMASLSEDANLRASPEPGLPTLKGGISEAIANGPSADLSTLKDDALLRTNRKSGQQSAGRCSRSRCRNVAWSDGPFTGPVCLKHTEEAFRRSGVPTLFNRSTYVCYTNKMHSREIVNNYQSLRAHWQNCPGEC